MKVLLFNSHTLCVDCVCVVILSVDRGWEDKTLAINNARTRSAESQ